MVYHRPFGCPSPRRSGSVLASPLSRSASPFGALRALMLDQEVIPKNHLDPSPPPERPEGMSPRERPGRMSRRGLLWALGLGLFVLLLLFIATRFDETLRRKLEAKINQHLQG